MKNQVTKNTAKQKGQGMTEYIIIVALIAIAAIGVYSLFGKTIRHQMAGMTMEMSGKGAQNEITQAGKAATASSKTAKEKVNLGNYDKTATKATKGN